MLRYGIAIYVSWAVVDGIYTRIEKGDRNYVGTGIGIAIVYGLIVWEPKNLEQELDEKRENTSKMISEQKNIIEAYGIYIEKDPIASGMEIRDSSKLPYEKDAILEALFTAIMFCDDDEQIQYLIMATHYLADFQDGVGSEPITQSGVCPDVFFQLAKSPEKLAALIHTPSIKAKSEKYQNISKKAEIELETIYRIVEKAQSYRQQRLLG